MVFLCAGLAQTNTGHPGLQKEAGGGNHSALCIIKACLFRENDRQEHGGSPGLAQLSTILASRFGNARSSINVFTPLGMGLAEFQSSRLGFG